MAPRLPPPPGQECTSQAGPSPPRLNFLVSRRAARGRRGFPFPLPAAAAAAASSPRCCCRRRRGRAAAASGHLKGAAPTRPPHARRGPARPGPAGGIAPRLPAALPRLPAALGSRVRRCSRRCRVGGPSAPRAARSGSAVAQSRVAPSASALTSRQGWVTCESWRGRGVFSPAHLRDARKSTLLKS